MITIEEGSVADCADFLAVVLAAFAEYKNKLNPESSVFRETVDTLEAKWREGYRFVIARIEGEMVGCLFYAPQGRDMYLGRLAVLPAYQKRGIARMMIEHVVQVARAEGFERLILSVRMVLRGNIRLFRSLGFQVFATGTHEGFSEPTYYDMAKEL